MKSELQYQPFVILGTARTGTTMLWSYLNSHPEILCLRGVYGSTNKINFGKFYEELPEEYRSEELVTFRNQKPIEFLEKYVYKKYAKPLRAVGFKYFYDHNRHLADKNELIDYFKENSDIKFIHLKRDNLLATLFSYKRALAQQQWTTANPNFHTTISVKECSEYFQMIISNQKQFNELFSRQTIQVSYDNLLLQTEQTIQEILKHIGVKKFNLKTETKKNTEIKLIECITNYTELKNRFINTCYAKYFNE
ncbi:MAG: sulfotransferase [Chitinophagaceae bacterium]|nr:MAG: sulfotransferase [Chitinophagaceae bacterium]